MQYFYILCCCFLFVFFHFYIVAFTEAKIIKITIIVITEVAAQ